jgi:hypothetical protein
LFIWESIQNETKQRLLWLVPKIERVVSLWLKLFKFQKVVLRKLKRLRLCVSKKYKLSKLIMKPDYW